MSWGGMPAVSPSTTARRIRNCVSANDGMAGLQRPGCDLVRAPRLGQQGGKRRNVVIPFDQCRLRAEAPNRVGVKLPDRLGNASSMGIDENFGTLIRFVLLWCEAAQVEFADVPDRQTVDVPIGAVPQIVCAEIHIADVAQEPASGSAHELTEEVELAHRRRVEADIARWILQEIGSAQNVLDLLNMRRD